MMLCQCAGGGGVGVYVGVVFWGVSVLSQSYRRRDVGRCGLSHLEHAFVKTQSQTVAATTLSFTRVFTYVLSSMYFRKLAIVYALCFFSTISGVFHTSTPRFRTSRGPIL